MPLEKGQLYSQTGYSVPHVAPARRLGGSRAAAARRPPSSTASSPLPEWLTGRPVPVRKATAGQISRCGACGALRRCSMARMERAVAGVHFSLSRPGPRLLQRRGQWRRRASAGAMAPDLAFPGLDLRLLSSVQNSEICLEEREPVSTLAAGGGPRDDRRLPLVAGDASIGPIWEVMM